MMRPRVDRQAKGLLVGAMRSILTVNHHTIHKEISVATTRWQTTFDLIGLWAYFTLMTGEMPDGKLLQEAQSRTEEDGLSVPTLEDHQPHIGEKQQRERRQVGH